MSNILDGPSLDILAAVMPLLKVPCSSFSKYHNVGIVAVKKNQVTFLTKEAFI